MLSSRRAAASSASAESQLVVRAAAQQRLVADDGPVAQIDDRLEHRAQVQLVDRPEARDSALLTPWRPIQAEHVAQVHRWA